MRKHIKTAHLLPTRWISSCVPRCQIPTSADFLAIVQASPPATRRTTEGDTMQWQRDRPPSRERGKMGRANTITTPKPVQYPPGPLSHSLPLSKSAAFGGDTLVSNSGTRTIKTEGGRGVRGGGWGWGGRVGVTDRLASGAGGGEKGRMFKDGEERLSL